MYKPTALISWHFSGQHPKALAMRKNDAIFNKKPVWNNSPFWHTSKTGLSNPTIFYCTTADNFKGFFCLVQFLGYTFHWWVKTAILTLTALDNILGRKKIVNLKTNVFTNFDNSSLSSTTRMLIINEKLVHMIKRWVLYITFNIRWKTVSIGKWKVKYN